jgi:ribosomal protein S12 methylthiotransferase accessory factor
LSTALPTAAGETAKRHRRGTHRVCPPEETLERVRPLFPRLGITRVADLTGLDLPGVPVFQAVRPGARSLTVSQGKGLTPALARVSAVMESLELWHAETIELPVVRARVREMVPRLSYDPRRLMLRHRSFFHDDLLIDWIPARALLTGDPSFVPRDYILLDRVVGNRFRPPIFRASSNGLASGNVPAEAVLHGLCEVVERDAIARWRNSGGVDEAVVDLDSVDDEGCREVLERFAGCGIDVAAWDITGPTGTPAYFAAIYSRDLPKILQGFGCHPDRGIALSRALTEAAQTRLTVIAGARDDLPARYSWLSPDADGLIAGVAGANGRVPFRGRASTATDDLDADVRTLAARVERQTGFPVVAVDLTRGELEIPVYFAVAPGLTHGLTHGASRL